ncbi:MAG: folate-binding protein [Pseudomonadota bacterium]
MSDDAMTSRLPERTVISVTGADRVSFLDGLLSVAVDTLKDGDLAYGALLTPQGKIVSDMMVFADADRLALDVPSGASDLMRRLTMYKLRAAVDLKETGEGVAVTFSDPPGARPDPRAATLGKRLLTPAPVDINEEVLRRYNAARIAAGVADGGADFDLGDAFPHDINMDLTGGVDFHKGCFVGQEVVSRMRHRGTARRRMVIAHGTSPLPAPGTPVTVDGKVVGRIGSSEGDEGLAMVRVDKVRGEAEAGGVALTVRTPEGAPFALAAE